MIELTLNTAQFNSRLQSTQLGLGTLSTGANSWKVDYEFGELRYDGTVDAVKNSGNIARQTLTVPGTSFVQSYRYDAVQRLTEAVEKTGSTTNWSQQFGYDRYGNRTSFSQDIGGITKNTTPAIDANTNRFTSTDFDYDANGNIVGDIDEVTNLPRQFIFNGDNKQAEVKRDGVTIGRYYYDGDGRRVKKVTDTETTVFVYAAGQLIAEYSTALSQTPSVSYTTADHLGSPRVITDELGQVSSRRDFMPFGEELYAGVGTRTGDTGLKYSSNQDDIRQKFTGYQKDTETNLDFAQARMYGNSHGRFTSPDPTLLSVNGFNPQSWNRYVYVLNNPLLYTDPLGLWAVRFDPVYKKDKDGNATIEIDHYIAVAIKTKDNDDAASLAKQLGLRGKEAEKFAKNFGEKLADGKITGDNVRLSKLGGDVGRVFGVVEDLYTDQKKYEARNGNDGKGPGNGTYADCSTTACNLADPMAGANGQNWSVHIMDDYIRSNGLKSVAEGDLRISDIIRYATGEGNRNVPAHFTTFIFMNDNGDPLVFGRSGEGGPFQVNTAKSFENATYGRIRGIGKDPTGYYRPR